MDYAIDCTGVIGVIEALAETIGKLGTLVLVGGAPAEASFLLDHLRTLWASASWASRAAVGAPGS